MLDERSAVVFIAAQVSGVWLIFLGWFIFGASRDEESQVRTQHALSGVRVADVMTSDPHTAPADITVEDFIRRYLLGDRHSAYPVADQNGSIIGLVALTQRRGLAPDQRTTALVREVAVPVTGGPDHGT